MMILRGCMRYYYAEHEAAYERIQKEGYTQWNDLFDQSTSRDFEDFQNRAFLETVMPRLDLPPPPETEVFEYGCGTGPAACFLAAQGFRVEAVDLIPEAITIAQRLARERGIRVTSNVQDICALATETPSKRYDVVLDSYCLQSIVTDEDRSAVFAAVHARLKPNGYYLLSTALYEPARVDEPGFHYDSATGIYYRAISDSGVNDGAIEFNGRWYQPHRRHLTPEALVGELTAAGFRVAQEGPTTGDFVCAAIDGPTT